MRMYSKSKPSPLLVSEGSFTAQSVVQMRVWSRNLRAARPAFAHAAIPGSCEAAL